MGDFVLAFFVVVIAVVVAAVVVSTVIVVAVAVNVAVAVVFGCVFTLGVKVVDGGTVDPAPVLSQSILNGITLPKLVRQQ